MQISNLDSFLWVAGFLGNVVLLFLLWRTSRVKRSPAFTSLIALSVVRSVTLFLLLRYFGRSSYFYAYWSLAIVDTVLQILVLGEAALHVFRPTRTWAPGSRLGLTILLLVSSIVSCFLTWLSSPPTQYLRQFVVIKGELFSTVLVSELLIGLLVMSVTLELRLTTDAAVVLEVLGFYSLKDLLIHGLQAHYGLPPGTATFVALSRLGIALYCLGLGYWIFAFRKKAPAPQELPDRMREQLLLLNNRVAAELRNLQSLGR